MCSCHNTPLSSFVFLFSLEPGDVGVGFYLIAQIVLTDFSHHGCVVHEVLQTSALHDE